MPMNHRLMVPRQTLHPEALAWKSAVIANGGSVSGTTLSAVSQFCKSIDAAGLRSRIYRLSLVTGANLSAALVPLYRGPVFGGTAYGNATDTNTNFVSGDYSLTTGLQGNGTTKYLQTGLTPDTIGVSTGHIATGFDTYVPATTESVLGASNGTTDRYTIFSSVGVTKKLRAYWGANSPAETVDYGASTPGGLYVSTRTSATSLTLYNNGSSVATLATSVTPGACPYDITISGVNSTGSPSGGFSGKTKCYSLGLSLTAAQVTALTTAFQAFMAAIGRSMA